MNYHIEGLLRCKNVELLIPAYYEVFTLRCVRPGVILIVLCEVFFFVMALLAEKLTVIRKTISREK